MNDSLYSYNPATGKVVGEVRVTHVDEIGAIVTAAHEAGRYWRDQPLELRARTLRRAGEQLSAHVDELGDLLSREMGKPLHRGKGEVKYCAGGIAARVDEMVAALRPEEIEDANTHSTLFYDPFGVCAVISPWNYPMSMPQSMILPALMAGNSVVLKPSEETPLIAQRYVEILNQFLPENVLQIIHGEDDQGRALVNADVNLIAFTGSRAVGKNILGHAADGLKRVVLELGGKDSLIVLNDADVEAAAQYAVANGFENAGQMCVSTERVYAVGDVADAFEERVTELVKQIKYGPWNEAGIRMGPMINGGQRDHVICQIDEAVSLGARVLTGGDNHPEHFVVPTVLTDCNHHMEIMQEETFGPVLCIQRVESSDEAIRLANDNPYGLGSAVYGSAEHAKEVARQLDAGMIGINKSCFGASSTPWVGAKQSGYGYHGSAAGHRQFAQLRVVSYTM
ncbi:aldehyde dehydrogenase family protein [Pseudomonadota bacterium]